MEGSSSFHPGRAINTKQADCPSANHNHHAVYYWHNILAVVFLSFLTY